jgi:predicted Ser/Thr protein kinase
VLAEGRIEVGSRIGGGAMGTVYEAHHDGLPVAIKILNRVQEHDVYRLKTEFRTLREMHHPNVVSVYELFKEQDTWFFTMERIDGLPIHRYLDARRLQRDRDDPDARFRDLRATFYQLVQGTFAIHEAGLVHRDLKPTNVLVGNDGRVVVIDFGLVSEQHAGGIGQTIDNRVSGTFGYMSPEQARGATATAASDCYALGAILCQLVRLGQPERAQDEPEAAEYVALGEQLMSLDPSRRPSAEELLAHCAAWGGEPTASTSLPSVENTFVGRVEQRRHLGALCRRATAEGKPVVVVHGPCGIGKSVLVRHLVTELQNEGALVLEGRCSMWESVPYRGLDGVMDRVTRLLLRVSSDESAYLIPRHVAAVLRLFPSLRRIPTFLEAAKDSNSENEEPFAVRRRAIAGLKDLLYRLSERRRVVILIEDLQWADADTLQILAELVSPPDHPTLCLLLTARAEDEALDELLANLRRVTDVETILLGALDDSDSRALARILLPEEPEHSDLLERVVQGSRGIPEYLSAFAHEIRIAPEGRCLEQLSDALLARIERLAEPPRRLLELIATTTRPIALPVANACGLPDVQGSVHVLLSQHLVRSVSLATGERAFDTYNDHVRKVTLHAITEERLVGYHLGLIRALEALPNVEPEWLLAHYRGAGCYARAKEYSVIIAEKAETLLAYDHAATMFLFALELTNEQSEDWTQLNLRCAEALTKAGRGAEAAAAYVRAARGLPKEKQLPLHSAAVEQWIRSGHVEKGVGLLRQTLEAVGIDWPETTTSAVLSLVSRRLSVRLRGLDCVPRPESETPPELLRKLDALRPAQTVLGTYDYLRGAAFSSLALPLALKAREPKRLLVALASEAIFAAILDGTDGVKRVDEVQGRIDSLAPHAEAPIEHAMPTLVRAVTSYWMGHWTIVGALARRAQTVLEARLEGTLWEASLARSVRHTVLLHEGRFDELAAELPDALSQATMYDDRYTLLDLERRVASIHLLRDEVHDAERVIAGIVESRRKHGIIAMDHLIMSLVVAYHLYVNDVAKARDELERRWTECRKLGMHRFPLVRMTVLGMRADCVLADLERSTDERVRELKGLARAAQGESVAWAGALRALLLGEAHAAEGSSSRASTEFARAASTYAECGLLRCSEAAKRRAKESQMLPADAALGTPDNPRWNRLLHSLY